jgi:hypothetical protein
MNGIFADVVGELTAGGLAVDFPVDRGLVCDSSGDRRSIGWGELKGSPPVRSRTFSQRSQQRDLAIDVNSRKGLSTNCFVQRFNRTPAVGFRPKIVQPGSFLGGEAP